MLRSARKDYPPFLPIVLTLRRLKFIRTLTGAEKNGKQAIGKSRGGWNMKIHAVTAGDTQVIGFLLSGGMLRTRGGAAFAGNTGQTSADCSVAYGQSL